MGKPHSKDRAGRARVGNPAGSERQGRPPRRPAPAPAQERRPPCKAEAQLNSRPKFLVLQVRPSGQRVRNAGLASHQPGLLWLLCSIPGPVSSCAGSPRGSRVSLSLAPHLGSRGAVVTRSLHRTLTTPAVSPAKLATDAYALASPNSPSVQEDVLLASAGLIMCMSSLGLLNTRTGRRHVGAAASF